MRASSSTGCAVCQRSLRKRRAEIVDGKAHCSECALLIAIARAFRVLSVLDVEDGASG